MKNKSVSRWVPLTALLAALLLAVCQGGAPQTVRIDVSLPLKGASPDTTSVGESIKRSF